MKENDDMVKQTYREMAERYHNLPYFDLKMGGIHSRTYYYNRRFETQVVSPSGILPCVFRTVRELSGFLADISQKAETIETVLHYPTTWAKSKQDRLGPLLGDHTEGFEKVFTSFLVMLL